MAPFQEVLSQDNSLEVIEHLVRSEIIDFPYYNGQDIFAPPDDRFSDWENDTRAMFIKVVLASVEFLGNMDTFAIIFVTFTALLAESTLFRVLMDNAMGTGILDQIRFENRYQLDNVPVRDLHLLKNLVQQRNYIAELSPDSVLEDPTRLMINETTYREEGNTIYINLPMLVNEMPVEIYLQFLNLFVHRLAPVLLNPHNNPELEDLEGRVANIIVEEFVRSTDGFFNLYPGMYTELYEFSQIAFLRTIMQNDRASRFLRYISNLAYKVNFEEPSNGNQFVRGRTVITRYSVFSLNLNFAPKTVVETSVVNCIQHRCELFSFARRLGQIIC